MGFMSLFYIFEVPRNNVEKAHATFASYLRKECGSAYLFPFIDFWSGGWPKVHKFPTNFEKLPSF
jgi:hypothetical protein